MAGANRRRAFSLVELMVVVGIIGILVAISATGLVMARRAAVRTESISNLRQLGLAWEQYAIANADRFTPGLVSSDAQQAMRLHAVYPDYSPVPPGPSFGAGQPNAAGPWVWRLVPYLDNDISLLQTDPDRADEQVHDYEQLGMDMAIHPAFAYNGWYVGGHIDVRSGETRPYTAFSKARMGDRRITNLVADSRGRMRHPERIAVFMPGRKVAEPGIVGISDDLGDPWYEVTPRYLADVLQWNTPTPEQIETLVWHGQIPTGRGTNDIPVHHADGHQSFHGITALKDQRLWIDGARMIDDVPAREFTHEAE